MSWVTVWTMDRGCRSVNSDSAIHSLYGQHDFGRERNGTHLTGSLGELNDVLVDMNLRTVPGTQETLCMLTTKRSP